MDMNLMPLGLQANPYSGTKGRVGQSDAYQDLIDKGWTIQDKNSMGLDMDDFLQLIVQQFQNQSIDQTASSTDMLNQLVQMSVVQAITQVSESIATMVDASTLTYAASLVGKTVTIGQYDKDGKLSTIVGEVTGTGTYQGSPVVFVDGKQYFLNEIMAIGKVPDSVLNPPEEGGEEEGGGEEGDSQDPAVPEA